MSSSPYDKLYVYQIKGTLGPEEEQALGPHFLGNWVEDDFSFLFFTESSKEIVDQLVAKLPYLEFLGDYEFTYEDWHGGELTPIEIGQFLIVPPWYSEEIKGDKTKVILDPGVVFGNGLHPTTRDCLMALEWLCQRATVDTVLDLGTGSGILSIAAALKGAKKVMAVDLNPLCVKTAMRNVMLNSVEGIVEIVEGNVLDYLFARTTLAIANIHYDVVKTLVEREEFLNRPWIILSGLMRTQWLDVRARLEYAGLRISKEWDHEMTWFTILCENLEG